MNKANSNKHYAQRENPLLFSFFFLYRGRDQNFANSYTPLSNQKNQTDLISFMAEAIITAADHESIIQGAA